MYCGMFLCVKKPLKKEVNYQQRRWSEWESLIECRRRHRRNLFLHEAHSQLSLTREWIRRFVQSGLWWFEGCLLTFWGLWWHPIHSCLAVDNESLRWKIASRRQRFHLTSQSASQPCSLITINSRKYLHCSLQKEIEDLKSSPPIFVEQSTVSVLGLLRVVAVRCRCHVFSNFIINIHKAKLQRSTPTSEE